MLNVILEYNSTKSGRQPLPVENVRRAYMKKCSDCKIEKESDKFYKRAMSRDGLAYLCKACDDAKAKVYRMGPNGPRLKAGHKKWRTENEEHLKSTKLQYSFGISINDYRTKLATQNDMCAICGKTTKENGRSLAVDHDRNCCQGRRSCGNCLRGLLCNVCNRSLGMLKDSVLVLESATQYLKKYKKAG